MSKRRKPSKNTRQSPQRNLQQTQATLNSMRGLVEAARAPYARRLITPAKAMSRINEQVRKFEHEYSKVPHHKRQTVSDVGSQERERLPQHKRNLPRQILSSQVRILYDDSRRALVCASRANRREVLFALRRTGKNGNRNRKAVWTPLSYVSCKKRG